MADCQRADKQRASMRGSEPSKQRAIIEMALCYEGNKKPA